MIVFCNFFVNVILMIIVDLILKKDCSLKSFRIIRDMTWWIHWIEPIKFMDLMNWMKGLSCQVSKLVNSPCSNWMKFVWFFWYQYILLRFISFLIFGIIHQFLRGYCSRDKKNNHGFTQKLFNRHFFLAFSRFFNIITRFCYISLCSAEVKVTSQICSYIIGLIFGRAIAQRSRSITRKKELPLSVNFIIFK